MRTATECRAMAARMDAFAARDSVPLLRAEWTSLAAYWRNLAHQAAWQDRHIGYRP